MVKVISAYNFQEQNTYSINGDIIGTCLIESNRLAIAQKNHLIEILCLNHKNTLSSYSTLLTEVSEKSNNIFQYDQNKNCPPTKTMFPTVDQVQKLLYCKAGHFLLTLEGKTDSHGGFKKRFVRIYVNFDIAAADNCLSTPIRARIASKVTPKTDSAACIEVIEIPINDNPDSITCCQMSGTIVVGCEKTLHFYEFKNRVNSAQRFTYIDFQEVPFYIELEFAPLKLKIEENVIACMNETTAIVFKIIDLIETNTEDGSTSNSLATGSSVNVFNQSTNLIIDYEVAKQCKQVNGIELQANIRSNWDTDTRSRTNFSEDKPVLVNDVKITLKYHDEYNNEHDGIFYSVKSLLQLRQPPSGIIPGQIHDEFRSVALKPIYFNHKRLSEIEKCQNAHVLKSAQYKNCIGFSVFVSTVSDGYLYQFTNQEKWYIENTKCLASYPFTSPVLDVIIDNYVIHAITENGIETFSSRVGHKLFSSYFEYPMLNAPYPNEIGPLLDVPICIMGICGFFGIKYVVSSDSNLILLSTCDEKVTSKTSKKQSGQVKPNDENDWTLYNLQLPKPETLMNDIQNLANIYKNSCSDIYYELMEEAHVIIRLARIFVSEHDDETKERLEKIFMNTCQLLADYTIMSDRKEIYSQAVAYYSMCKYPVWDIYKQFMSVQSEQPASQFKFRNLIYTLKIILSNLKSNKTDGDFLTQNVKPLLYPQKKSNEHNVAEEFLDFFMLYAPEDIATTCLVSSVFREILNSSLIRLFSEAKNLSNDEQLCYILCLFKNHETFKAIEMLDQMKPKHLLHSLKQHWIVLFENFDLENYRKATFSDFTETILFSTKKPKMIEAISDVFIHLLVVARFIDLDFILHRFMNYFAVNLGQKGYCTSQQILEILLQGYFYDVYYINNRNIDGKLMTEISTNQSSEILVGTESHSSLCLLNDHEKLSLTSQQQQFNSGNNSKSDFVVKIFEESNITDYNYEDAESEAMKILFRMYLGWLKQYSDRENQEIDRNSSSEVIGYRLAFIDYMFHHSKLIKRVHAKFDKNYSDLSYDSDVVASLYDDNCVEEDNEESDKQLLFRRRPILFFERREEFLNTMPPFNENSFKRDSDGVQYFDDWDKDVNVILIKIQALLNSGKLNGSLIEDFITFIHSNPNVTGIDSLIGLLLPKPDGFIEFLIHIMPKNLLSYAKSRISSPPQWQALIKRILNKKRSLSIDEESTTKFYDKIIYEILEYLASEKSLDDLLNCIPDEELNKNKTNCYYDSTKNDCKLWKQEQQNQGGSADDTEIRKHSYDGIDETDPFQLIMRSVVAKQRSDALCAMIQSTGRQLYDAMNNSQLHLN